MYNKTLTHPKLFSVTEYFAVAKFLSTRLFTDSVDTEKCFRLDEISVTSNI